MLLVAMEMRRGGMGTVAAAPRAATEKANPAAEGRALRKAAAVRREAVAVRREAAAVRREAAAVQEAESRGLARSLSLPLSGPRSSQRSCTRVA